MSDVLSFQVRKLTLAELGGLARSGKAVVAPKDVYVVEAVRTVAQTESYGDAALIKAGLERSQTPGPDVAKRVDTVRGKLVPAEAADLRKERNPDHQRRVEETYDGWRNRGAAHAGAAHAAKGVGKELGYSAPSVRSILSRYVSTNYRLVGEEWVPRKRIKSHKRNPRITHVRNEAPQRKQKGRKQRSDKGKPRK